MKKIVLLTPCLMLDNNREVNHKAITKNHELPVDHHVIFAQEFNHDDYMYDIEYIGSCERAGFAKSRNELLKYFYNSDYDYALWMDGNATLSKSSLNDMYNLIHGLKNEIINIDACTSTLGICVNKARMDIKSKDDYFTRVTLIPSVNNCEWFHGLIIKNFKKYYNQELYIDEKCDPKNLLPEDIYFIRLLDKYYNVYCCPTITINKPPSKTSTWMNNEDGYNYPPIDYKGLQLLVDSTKYKSYKKSICFPLYINRTQKEYIEDLAEYKSRSKKDKVVMNKASLF